MFTLTPKTSPYDFLDTASMLLSHGVTHSKHPFHQGALGTYENNTIQQRYVVLRRWNLKRRTLMFHTDIRSAKVSTIKKNPNTSFLFYSKENKLQLRFECTSHIHNHNRLALYLYKQTTSSQRKCYQSKHAPSKCFGKNYEQIIDHSIDPYFHFCVCVCNFNRLELLHLHHQQHTRILYEWSSQSRLSWNYLSA